MSIARTMIVAGLLALTATAALAEPVLPAPNALGLYFDAEAASHDLTLGAPATVDVYLIFTEPTVDFITAWEAKVTISGGAAITGAEFPLGTTAVADGPAEWSTTMSSPMPCNALTKLAVFAVTSDAGENTFLYLGSLDNPSVVSDLPAVQLQDGSWTAVPVASGDVTLPVATINSSTPNETSNWGSVKNLYR